MKANKSLEHVRGKDISERCGCCGELIQYETRYGVFNRLIERRKYKSQNEDKVEVFEEVRLRLCEECLTPLTGDKFEEFVRNAKKLQPMRTYVDDLPF
jgi:hypothetical protein